MYICQNDANMEDLLDKRKAEKLCSLGWQLESQARRPVLALQYHVAVLGDHDEARGELVRLDGAGEVLPGAGGARLERPNRLELGVGDDVVGVDVDLERVRVVDAHPDVALLHVDPRLGQQPADVHVDVSLARKCRN